MKDKYLWKRLIMTVLICAVMVALIPMVSSQKVSAVDKEFTLTLSRDSKSLGVSLPSDGEWKEVQVLDYQKNVLKTQKSLFFANFNLKKNKAGMVRYRTIDNDGTPLTDWSETIGFASYSGSNVKMEGKKKLYASYKLPKIKGVKKYIIYLSNKQNKGYKKVKSAKPGTKVVLKNYKKKSFKYYKNYYVRIEYVVKGADRNAVRTTGFYFTKTFFSK